MNLLINFPEIKNAYSYIDYRNTVTGLAEGRRTSGLDQLLERIDATKLNSHRMRRIDKQIELSDSLKKTIQNIKKKLTLIVIAESWCGDGAQNIPMIAKIADLSTNIELKIIFRDENIGIMDSYLTNGSRSIPKVVFIDSETNEELGTWGPRPAKIQEMVKEYKAQFPESSHDEFVRSLHLWYAKDMGEALQDDFEKLLTPWTV
jgi:hypothetical protein